MDRDVKDDDEITIDFGKIMNFFKRKKEAPQEIKEEAEEIKGKIEEKIEEDKEEIMELKKEEKEIEKVEEKIEKIEKKEKELDKLEENVEKEEEEIAIDFSKIKNFFKSKTSKEDVKTEERDEEVAIDFSKIKSFFKGREKEKRTEEESGEEISIDWRGVYSFFVKNRTLFLILIPLLLSVFFRMMPAYLPVTYDWATSSVYNNIRAQIRSGIEQQYPNLPDPNKNELVETQLREYLKQNRKQVDEGIRQTSLYFKSRLQDSKGHTYLLAIDPYFWMRHARNILKNGHVGDSLKDGKPYDNFMYAPRGRFIPGDVLNAYAQAYLFKIINFFNRNIDLMGVAFYVPIIVASLSVIPAFFIARKIGGDLAGFIAALLVAVSSPFMSRTAGGFSDTDAYTVLLPFMITWLFLEAFESNDTKKIILLSSLAGFFVGLFSFAWGGWWYILDFLLAAGFVYLIYFIIMHRKELLKDFTRFLKLPAIRSTVIVVVVFFASSAIFVSLFIHPVAFMKAPTNPLYFATLKEVAVAKIWPNVLTTVAEQNEATLEQVIATIGGGSANAKFMFFIGVIGVILTMLKKDRHGKVDVKYAILLSLWFIATIYASRKGVRFIQLLVPAFSVAFGIALGISYQYISKWVEKGLQINRKIANIVLISFFFLVLVNPFIASGYATAKNELPSMNDAWFESLDKINREAEQDAIINSWWDFGHWFKAIGNRSVTFDGTSQDSPQAHWIGKVLLTDDEKVAVGILRMVDCSAHYAFYELDKYIKKPYKTVEILNEIIVLDKKGAKKRLEGYGLTDKQIKGVLELTHCEAPENYFIASGDMIGKSGVWGHFGSWDFRRATIFNKIKNKTFTKEKAIGYLQSEFNYSKDEATSLYYEVTALNTGREANDWIAPWPSYASGLTGCNQQGDTWRCGNGLIVDMKTHEAQFRTPQGVLHPNSIVWPDESDLQEKKYYNKTAGVSAAVIPKGEGYVSILMSPALAKSMFTRLFFMNGHGLRHFKLFSYQRSVTGGEVYVYKVDWEGGDMNLMPEIQEKIKAREEIRAEHILVNSSEEAERLLEEIKDGADFKRLAKRYSSDKGSAVRGGDVGWFKRGTMVKEFEEAAFALGVGEVSDVVRSPFGYHIIRVTGKRNEIKEEVVEVVPEEESEEATEDTSEKGSSKLIINIS
jgi:dolichyl-diphosphooligosaccharide--protein glycosyltransferase